jgi:hypothetical protein
MAEQELTEIKKIFQTLTVLNLFDFEAINIAKKISKS